MLRAVIASLAVLAPAAAAQDDLSGAGIVARAHQAAGAEAWTDPCLLYTSPSPRDRTRSRMPSSA